MTFLSNHHLTPLAHPCCPFKVRLWAEGLQHHALTYAPSEKAQEKTGRERGEVREKQANVTAQLRAAAPDSQSYWESQHFLIIQDE